MESRVLFVFFAFSRRALSLFASLERCVHLGSLRGGRCTSIVRAARLAVMSRQCCHRALAEPPEREQLEMGPARAKLNCLLPLNAAPARRGAAQVRVDDETLSLFGIDSPSTITAAPTPSSNRSDASLSLTALSATSAGPCAAVKLRQEEKTLQYTGTTAPQPRAPAA